MGLDWAQIGYFFLGVFLVVQALELSKEALVWYGGISTLFFVVIAYWILMWVKNQGNVAKYTTAAMGMWGAAMSNVLVKNMSIIFSVIVQHNYLIYAVIGVFSLSIIGAFYFKPKEEKTRNKVRDIISGFFFFWFKVKCTD